ncbi:MAG: transketolase [Candidatus Koribacter versatilis]|uniref:Transketolase n=1 Tax=Candidatus Korobacter versatilis TaxID=658062 RepID=A0A932A960_9BACT|nr:transketolase [Candidatus Koribacter versatilis]
MSIVDSRSGKVRREYSVAELAEQARLMRGYDLTALCAAGSGHAGGTLSIMDVAAALYLRVADHDPQAPEWAHRDRVVWSAGHKAPALYLALAFSGYFDRDDVMQLRRLSSPFQGHPHWRKLPGVEASTGSLGQGLSIAVGLALAARLDGRKNKVFCIMGDGEQQEGQVWEAAMEAAHYHLDNLIAIIDENRLQIDGATCDVMDVEPLDVRYAAFGWEVMSCDGHDMERVVNALEYAKSHAHGKPTLIVAKTVKGKGVSFMENVAGWHGRVPTRAELVASLKELGLEETIPYEALLAKAGECQQGVDARLAAKMPRFSQDYWWNAQPNMKVEMKPTRMGFGEALAARGDDERVVCLGLDISGSITISEFYAKHPERKPRWLSLGIAEQSATSVAAGLAREGKLPVFGTYATFAAARNLDQIRVSVCYANLNVLIAGAHGGVSVGPDGATHQALEDLFAICGLPNMVAVVPCDSVETRRATEHLLFEQVGPKYIRFAREATPIVTTAETPFVFGRANVIRFRGEQPRFADAFTTTLAGRHCDEQEDLSILACGPMVPEAMRAAWILKRDFGWETRVLNLHTLKPLDEAAILRAAQETGVLITAEEHQVGALAWRVSEIVTRDHDLYGTPVLTGAIGVQDRFGDSGSAWELVKEFEVSAEHIAHKAAELMAVKQGRLDKKAAREVVVQR